MTARDLANRLGGTLQGDPGVPVRRPVPLQDAGPEDTTFLLDSRSEPTSPPEVGILICATLPPRPIAKAYIVVKDPRRAMAHLLEMYASFPALPEGISPLSWIAPDARVEEGVRIGPGVWVGRGTRIGRGSRLYPGVFVGEEVIIGEDCVLYPGVYLAPGTRLGHRVILHPGVVIGADGYGYISDREGHRKIPQIGRVVIEDDVEIGANSCVDRATLGETRIGRGTKIDNLVQIAHNVRIGEHCLIVSQTGIAGSTTLGHRVVLAGQVGVADHVHIPDGTVVTAKSGVSKSLPRRGMYASGWHVLPRNQHLRLQALYRKLPEMAATLESLNERLKRLEERLDATENPS